MKTYLIALLTVATSFIANAQGDKYANTFVCSKGMIHFFSATAMENIEATSNTAVCVINTQTKKVYAKVQMTSFVFEKKLMQEHFNENYMESDDYPNGILDAVIVEDIDFTKDGTYNITLRGTFEVHGVKQTRDIPGVLVIKNGQPASATAKFNVKLADHKIAVPKAIIMNIAESIDVDINFTFEKYQKN